MKQNRSSAWMHAFFHYPIRFERLFEVPSKRESKAMMASRLDRFSAYQYHIEQYLLTGPHSIYSLRLRMTARAK